MKHSIISIIAILTVCLSGWGQTQSEWESDGYSLRIIDDSNHHAEITGYNGDLTELRIPDQFRKDGITYTITSIGRKAFYFNRNLNEVVLPGSLTHIGEMAFTGCCNLRTIVLSESLTAIAPFGFTETGVNTMVVPDGVSILDYDTFMNCSKLNTLVLGKGVKIIDNGAMAQLPNLKELYVLSPTIPQFYKNTRPFCDALCSDATVYVPSELLSQYPVRPEGKRTNSPDMLHAFEDDWWYFHNYKPIPDLFTVLYKDHYSIQTGESVQILFETVNFKNVSIYRTEWICDDEGIATVSDGFITGNMAGTTKGRVCIHTNQGTFTSKDFDISITGSEVSPSPRKSKGNEEPKMSLIDDEKVGIYSINGLYLGSDIDNLAPGIYIQKTGDSTKIINVN